MSRAHRRRHAAAASAVPDPGTSPAGQRPPEAAATAGDPAQRHIVWRACLAGVVVGELLLLLLTNGGLALANVAFGPLPRLDGGIVGVGSFLAVIVGGYCAARLAGRWGVYQGTVVGIGFIVVAVVVQFAQEASIVHASLGVGPVHHLVDLGPMRMDNLITGDLLALLGGSVGGWLARRP